MVLGPCVREYGLGPVVVGSEATCPCSSAGVAARARMRLAVVRRDSGSVCVSRMLTILMQRIAIK